MPKVDRDESGKNKFGEFCQLCNTFLVEDPDIETMQKELKVSFRVFDREVLGYILTNNSEKVAIARTMVMKTI